MSPTIYHRDSTPLAPPSNPGSPMTAGDWMTIAIVMITLLTISVLAGACCYGRTSARCQRAELNLHLVRQQLEANQELLEDSNAELYLSSNIVKKYRQQSDRDADQLKQLSYQIVVLQDKNNHRLQQAADAARLHPPAKAVLLPPPPQPVAEDDSHRRSNLAAMVCPASPPPSGSRSLADELADADSDSEPDDRFAVGSDDEDDAKSVVSTIICETDVKTVDLPNPLFDSQSGGSSSEPCSSSKPSDEAAGAVVQEDNVSVATEDYPSEAGVSKARAMTIMLITPAQAPVIR